MTLNQIKTISRITLKKYDFLSPFCLIQQPSICRLDVIYVFKSSKSNVKITFANLNLISLCTFLELYFCLRNETHVPVFYQGNKVWVRDRVRMN